MTTKILKSIVYSVLIFSSPLWAACSSTGCTNVSVDRLYINSSTVFIGTSGDERSLNCTAGSNSYIALRPTHPNYDQIYSLLLAVQFSDKIASIYIVQGTAGCDLSYVVVNS